MEQTLINQALAAFPDVKTIHIKSHGLPCGVSRHRPGKTITVMANVDWSAPHLGSFKFTVMADG